MANDEIIKKSGHLHFSGRHHSEPGIASVVIGVVAWLIFVTTALVSASENGEAEMPIGFIGLIIAIIGICGTICGIKGTKQQDVYYVAPITGMAINCVLLIFLFTLYVIGIVVA